MKQVNKVPELTSLQFLVIEIIGPRKMRGAELRERLKERRVFKTGPAFYQLMARLEEAEFVEGWYDQEVVDGQIIKQRLYRVTGLGARAHRGTRNFYIGFGGKELAYAQK